MTNLTEATGFDAGLTGDGQIRLVLRYIIDNGGVAQTRDFYEVINRELASTGYILSNQGKARLRFFINKVAVDAAWFITTGKLSSEHRREAGEADVRIVEGREEVKRISNLHGLESFQLFEDGDTAESFDEEV